MHLRKVRKYLQYFLLGTAGFLLLVFVFLNLPFTQRLLTSEVNQVLGKSGVPVHLETIRKIMPGSLDVQGIVIRGVKGDTIIFVGELEADIRLRSLLRNHVVLKKLVLDAARVSLHSESDEQKLNIAEAFQSGNPEKALPRQKPPSRWEISVRTGHLTNIHFRMEDTLSGIHIAQDASELELSSFLVSLPGREIFCKSLFLGQADGQVNLGPRLVPPRKKTSSTWNIGFQKLALDRVGFCLTNSADSLRLKTEIKKASVRADHLDLSSRTADIKSISFQESSVSFSSHADSARTLSGIELEAQDLLLDSLQSGVEIKKAAFDLQNGFSLKQLSGTFSSGRDQTRLRAELRTGNSQIELSAEAGGGIQDIILRPGVTGEATLQLKGSRLSLYDLSFFMAELEDLPAYALLAGSPFLVEGRLDLKGSLCTLSEWSVAQEGDFDLRLEGDIRNPFRIPDAVTNINFGISGFDRSWLEKFAAGFGMRDSLPDLSDLVIHGNISDSLFAPKIKLGLVSKPGRMDLLGSLDFRDEHFQMSSSLEGVAVGEILGITDLGSFTGSGEIKGRGFSQDLLHASFYLQIDTLGFREYKYSHTQLTGTLEPGSFSFQMVANDTSLKADIQASLNLAGSALDMQLAGLIQVQLNELNLYEDTLALETHVEAFLNSEGESLKSVIRAKDIRITNPHETAELKALNASFNTDSVATSFHGETDFLKADLNIAEPFHKLDSLGRQYKNYFTSFRNASHLVEENRVTGLPETDVSGAVRYHELFDIIMKDTGFYFGNLDFSFRKQADHNSLQASVRGDSISIKMIDIGALEAAVTDSSGNLVLELHTDSTSLFSSPENRWALHGRYYNGKLLTSLSVDNYRKQVLYQANIEGRADSGRIYLEIPDQLLTLNGEQWKLNQPDLLSIDLSDNRIFPTLRMNKDSASINLTSGSREPMTTYVLDIKQVELESLFNTTLITGSPEGTLSGHIDFRTDRDWHKDLSSELQISDVSFAGKDLHDILLDGRFSSRDSGSYSVDLLARMDSINITMKGARSEDGTRNLDGVFSNLPLVTLKPFAEQYVSDLKGYVSGNISTSVQGDNEQVKGELLFHEAQLKVNILNSVFRIPTQKIVISDDKMHFQDFTILDTLNRPLKLNGYLDFSSPEQVLTDLAVTSSNLRVMSRDKESKIPFTGDIFIDSRLTMKGPLLQPDLKGKLQLADGTELYYNQMEDLRMTETEKVVNFVDRKAAPEEIHPPAHIQPGILTSSSIETIIEIDPKTEINFTLAKKMFDIILNVKGGGNVQYSMGNGRMTLSGKYEIGDGSTLLKLVGWPNKSFTLVKGGYLSWDGVIENPQLSVDAESKVSTSYVNPIDNKNRDIDIFVILRLSGNLSDLDVLFTLRTQDQYVMSVINTLSPEEKMQQAMSVLLFEVIDLPGISSSTDYMTQQVNQILSSQLNQFTKSAIKGVDISFGLNSYDQTSQDGGDVSTTSLSYDVSKSLMNNRAQIEVSGRFNDVNQQASGSDHSLNNVSFEYQLDSAASKYLKVYNEHTYDDVFEGEVVRTGIGFSYKKRYRTFRDIWRREK